MSDIAQQQQFSGFDLTTCFVSTGSIFGSLYASAFLIPSAVNRDLYGGTAVLVLVVVMFQVLGFVGAVGIPGLVFLLRGRFHMSRVTLWFLAFGLAGIAAEVLGLILIPKGSNC